MRRPKTSASGGLAAALAGVAAEAGWEACDLVARRGRAAAPDLLRGRSAELAGSAVAREQLLSAALDQAAAAIAADAPAQALDLDRFLTPQLLDEDDRVSLRRQAEALPSTLKAPLAPATADRLARAHAEARRADDDAPPVAARLREDAMLAEALWADARLPAERDARIVMLASIPHLRAQARASEAEAPWWRRLARRLWP